MLKEKLGEILHFPIVNNHERLEEARQDILKAEKEILSLFKSYIEERMPERKKLVPYADIPEDESGERDYAEGWNAYKKEYRTSLLEGLKE